MRVLHIIDSLSVGGAEVLTVNVVNLLYKEKDIEPYLCVTRKEGPLKKDLNSNINYTFLQKKSLLDVTFYKSLSKYVKNNKINILHAHNTSFFSCVLIKILFYRNAKIVWHNHTGAYVNLKGVKYLLLKHSSRFFDTILNVNKSLNEWSKKNLNTKSNHVLNNFASFSNEQTVTRLRGKKNKRIVCIAGLRPVKDHENLIKAFENVLLTHSDWTLHLVGKNYDDLYAEQIIDMVLERNLEERIFFYGLCHDIKHILSQSTIGVLNSKKEGFPISVLEYGLAKLPVVLTDVGNNKRLIGEGEALVVPDNHEKLSTAICKMIEDHRLRSSISKKLHNEVSNFFSEEYFIKRLKSIYFKL